MVEKMELLHITGPKDDIDRVMDVYLSKYDIHFENAIASLSSLAYVRPFAETNVYKDVYGKAKDLWEYLGEEPGAGRKRWSLPRRSRLLRPPAVS